MKILKVAQLRTVSKYIQKLLLKSIFLLVFRTQSQRSSAGVETWPRETTNYINNVLNNKKLIQLYAW